MEPDAKCNSTLCNDSCQIISSRWPVLRCASVCLSKPFMWWSNQNPPTERSACTVEGLIYRNYTQLTHFLVCKDLDTAWFGTAPLNGTGRPTLTSTTLDSESLVKRRTVQLV